MVKFLVCLLFFGPLFVLIGGQKLKIRPEQEVQVKPIGDAIIFTCVYTGADEEAKVKLQWFDENKVEIVSKSERLYFEEDETENMKKLYITQIEESDAGVYSCNVEGSEEMKSVKLEIYQDITFGDFLLTQHPKVHSDALISCVVSGRPQPVVTFRHNGRRLQQGERYSVDPKQGLTIRNITQADDGLYICSGEVGADGRYKERRISVVVHIPPEITNGLGNIEAVQETNVSISCNATGLPHPTFKFFKNNGSVALETGENRRVDESAGVVHFTSVTKSDEGTYTCRAENDVGVDNEDGHLKVLVKPSIFSFDDESEKEGSSVTLTCRSEGDPIPNVTFRKEGKTDVYELGPNDDDIVVSSNKPGQLDLVIESLTIEDAGKYVCNSMSAVGTDEKIATLIVYYKPTFADTEQKKTVFNWVGKSQNLTCHSLGLPTPSIEWLKSDVKLNNNDTFHIYDMGANSNLQVQVGQFDQPWIYGDYVCLAKNNYGQTPLVIEMQQAAVPGAPSSASVLEKYPTEIVFRVEAPLQNGGVDVIGYNLEYHEHQMTTTTIQIPFSPSPSSSDNEDDDDDEEPKRAKTPDDGEDEDDDDADDEEDASNANTVLTTPRRITETFIVHVTETVESSDNKIRAENLKADTTYLFKFRARNEVGLSRPFNLTVTTPPYDKPQTVVIKSKDKSDDPFSYVLSWEKPNTGGLPIKEYEFHIKQVTASEKSTNEGEEKDAGADWKIFRMKDDAFSSSGILPLHHKLTELIPNTFYKVKVRAKNEMGWSETSKVFVFSTIQDPSVIISTTVEKDEVTTAADFVDDVEMIANRGSDREDPSESESSSEKAGIGTGLVIGIVFAIFGGFLVIVDVCCYFSNGCGITMFICVRCCGKTKPYTKEKAMEEGEREQLNRANVLQDDESKEPLKDAIQLKNADDHHVKGVKSEDINVKIGGDEKTRIAAV